MDYEKRIGGGGKREEMGECVSKVAKVYKIHYERRTHNCFWNDGASPNSI